jgi:hypothetical protein
MSNSPTRGTVPVIENGAIQFQASIDSLGNLYCSPGYAIDLGAATTAYFGCGIVDADRPALIESRAAPVPALARFLGGSGKNMALTGTLSGTNAPLGYFRQTTLASWQSEYGHTIDFDDGANTADLLDTDGTTVIATFSASSTIAPVGSFSSTATGASIYNGGTSFTLTSSYEGTAAFEDAEVVVSDGTAQDGTYTFSTDRWVSSVDPNFEIVDVANDGTFRIYDGTDYVADRIAGGPALDPTGSYVATSYGEGTYNNSDPFNVEVALGYPMPIVGYVYVELTLSSGRITAGGAPKFAATLPANSSTLEVVPVAYSDGAGKVIQIQQGPILWK